MLPQLEAILRASAKVVSIDVLDNDPIDGDHYLFMLRCQLTSGTKLQIRLRAVAGRLRYSYQEFDVAEIQRWDNAPHFSSPENSSASLSRSLRERDRFAIDG